MANFCIVQLLLLLGKRFDFLGVVDIARLRPPAHGERDVGAGCVVPEGCGYVDGEEGWVAVALAVALEYDG